jgi:hypothetical protein
MRSRFSFSRTLLVMPFDTHDGKNDDGRGFIKRLGTAKAHNAPVGGEVNNDAHLAAQPLSAAYGAADPLADATRIGVRVSKPHAGLTLR